MLMCPLALWFLLFASIVAGYALSLDAGWRTSRSIGASELIANQKVFILTMPRSGSSFMGEIFLQNPHFQYLFEPARGFSEEFSQDACSPTPTNPALENVIKAIYNCDFSVLKNYTELHSWKGHIYSWDRIAAFSGKEKTNLCLPPNSSSPAARKVSVATKEVEMWAPKLNWLYDTIGSDLHIIWLVRDVRGWVSSWLLQAGDKESFYKDWGYDKRDLWARYSQCAIVNCGAILDHSKITKIKGILNNSSSAPHLKMAAWWTLDTAVAHYYFSRFKGKVLLVKYEDLSSQPYEIVQQIYAFLNQSHVHEKGDIGNRYDTYRNSPEMAAVWRTRLTPGQIADIEDIAGVWFSYFGYNTL